MKLISRILLVTRLLCVIAFTCQPLWILKTAAAHNIPYGQKLDKESGQVAQVHAILQKELAQADGPISFLVILRDQFDIQSAAQSADARSATFHARTAFLHSQLTRHAQSTQASLRTWLDAQGVPYRPFYIVNVIEVTGDAKLVQRLSRRPDVARLVANPRIQQKLIVDDAGDSSTLGNQRDAVTDRASAQANTMRMVELTGTTPLALSVPYGLANAKAPEVWALGYEGQGIVVASQDTGVEWEHPVLKTHYRGWNAADGTASHQYNWFDAWGQQGRPASCSSDAQIPCDDHGHGTHTVGTMLGKDEADQVEVLGMAPKAEWIGCRNMENGVGTPASYIACFQFMLAPYPQDGDPEKDNHPELAPHIINNSWSCPPSEGCDAGTLQQIVETMRAAGIMVVASAGNDGSSCQTVQDPIAIYDAAFSVGAHDVNGTIASFSSRGPVTIDGSNRPKPDITAPGVDVYSAWLTNSFFNGYRTASGTSMASPHMAGAVALLWSAEPRLIGQIDQTEQILIKSATPVPFGQCGEAVDAVPNMTYGYGQLNILAAVEMAQNPTALTVHIQGANAVGLPDALVTLIDQQTGYRYTATSSSNGAATFAALYTGSYMVQVNASEAAFVGTKVQITGGETQEVTLSGGQPIYMPIVVKE